MICPNCTKELTIVDQITEVMMEKRLGIKIDDRGYFDPPVRTFDLGEPIDEYTCYRCPYCLEKLAFGRDEYGYFLLNSPAHETNQMIHKLDGED